MPATIGVPEVQGPDHALLHEVSDRLAGGLLQHQADKDVVGVAVRPVRSRREHRRVGGRDIDELARAPVPVRVREHSGQEVLVVGVVEDAAGVVEQHAEGDRGAVGDDMRQPALDGVPQRQPALLGELQGHHRDRRLGDAPDPELVRGPERKRRVETGGADGEPSHSVPVIDQRADPGGPGTNECLHRGQECRVRGGLTRTEGGGRDAAARGRSRRRGRGRCQHSDGDRTRRGQGRDDACNC